MLPTHKGDTATLKVLCFTFRHLSPKAEFLICCALVFVFYLIYGYFAELIFTFEGVSGWYITLVQFFFYTLFGLFENVKRTRSVPINIYLLLAFLTLGTMVSCKNWNYDCWRFNDFSLSGTFKLLFRISQLSHANHLQKLQAYSSSHWINTDPEEET